MSEAVDDDLVNNFQAITHASEANARMFLAAADSDLQNAIAMYFAADHGEDARRSNQSNGNQVNSPPVPTTTRQIPSTRAPQVPQPRRRRPFGFILRTVGAIFSSALHVADWIVGLVLPEGAHRSLRGILSRLIGRTNLPTEALPDSLQRQYGENVLTFCEGTWQDALAAATQLQRPLLLYIHAPDHINTPRFCQSVLCDNRVTTYARSHFIAWATQVGTPSASQLTGLLRVTSFPYLAVLVASPPHSAAAAASSSVTVHRRQPTLRMLASIDGAASAATVMDTLEGAVAAASASSRGATQRANAAAEARSVRQEQDAALAASMAEDQRRAEAAAEERRRVEAEQQAEVDRRQAEQEEQRKKEQAIEDRRNAVITRREEKRAALPAEPENSTDGCALIRVKLPQGASAQRRFRSGAAVGDVYDWVDSLDQIDAFDYVLTSTYPRREYPRAESDVLLSDVGLVPNAALMVIIEDE
eukprot:jgi/Ulvmu1/8158/UM040_0055.1